MTGDTATETRPDHRPGGLHTLAHVILWATRGRRGPAPVLLAWAIFAFVAWRGLR